MNRRLEERRAEHERYKQDIKERGKPFYPYAMFHDTVMSLLVVTLIVVLTVVWKFTAEEGTSEEDSGLLGKLYDEKADPATRDFVPRPDWYFYFLFYLLRIFKWPDSVILGTVGIPTIAMILLLAFPFLDVGRERRPLRRPVAMVAALLTIASMGVLTYKGATARESLGAELVALVPEWAEKEGFAGNTNAEAALPLIQRGLSDQEIASQAGGDVESVRAIGGAYIFARVGCAQCHTYLGAGTANLGAPDLTDEGNRNRGLQWQIDHLKDPQSTSPGSPMPDFARLGEERLRTLAIWLEASKGPK